VDYLEQLPQIPTLVVEDVNVVRVQIRELLRSVGFRNIYEAKTGAEAAQLINENDIQVILCDCHLDGLDGLSLLQYMKEQQRLSGAVFIMVSADNTKKTILLSIQAGVDDYIVKPLKADQIRSKVLGHMRKKGVFSK